MSTAPSLIYTIEADAKSVISTVVSDVKGFFGSSVGQTITGFAATASGIATGWALIEELNPSNKVGTANDIYTVCSAIESELGGATPPSLAQIQSVMIAFKSNTATQNYASLVTTISAAVFNFISKYSGSNWVAVATDFVTGLQYAAAILSGVALPSTTSPVTPAVPANASHA